MSRSTLRLWLVILPVSLVALWFFASRKSPPGLAKSMSEMIRERPTPYYDANDGFPAFLLLNDGSGQFQEATGASGLEVNVIDGRTAAPYGLWESNVLG